MDLKISSGKVARPQKVVIYGVEGIGKTTLASKFPGVLFIDTEGGSSHLDVRRIEGIFYWSDLMSALTEISGQPGLCQTLVIDTADWAEQMCIKAICSEYKKSGIEDFGYGRGYTYLAEEFNKFLNACNAIVNSGVNVVITAHAKMRKFEQPDEQGAYDRWEMKLSKTTAPLLKEWADMLLFLNYRTYVIHGQNEMAKNKATGGDRVIYTNHHPCWDAKNRHGLEDCLPLAWESISECFPDLSQPTSSNPEPQPVKKVTVTEGEPMPDSVKATEPVTEQMAFTEVSENSQPSDCRKRLKEMMDERGFTEQQIQAIVGYRNDSTHMTADIPVSEYSDAFIEHWLIKYWDQIVQMIDAHVAG